jgi:hypothetical protein
MATIVFGGFPGVGKRSIITRMLEIGSSKITSMDGYKDPKWTLKTKYFIAELIPLVVENPSELSSAGTSEAVFEVC